jgi:hypothetical protein
MGCDDTVCPTPREGLCTDHAPVTRDLHLEDVHRYRARLLHKHHETEKTMSAETTVPGSSKSCTLNTVLPTLTMYSRLRTAMKGVSRIHLPTTTAAAAGSHSHNYTKTSDAPVPGPARGPPPLPAPPPRPPLRPRWACVPGRTARTGTAVRSAGRGPLG